MRATLVLVFVAAAALASAEAKTWEEDDMIIVEGKFGRRSRSAHTYRGSAQ